jgi:hypothetical protein
MMISSATRIALLGEKLSQDAGRLINAPRAWLLSFGPFTTLFTPIDQGSAADVLGTGGAVRRMTAMVEADEATATNSNESSHSVTILLM